MNENLIFDAMSHSNALLGYGSCGCCHGECYTTEEDDREVAAAIARGLREVCTIRTVEQLDALPSRSLVRDEQGEYFDKLGAGWDCLSENGEGGLLLPTAIRLPALLIWHPDWARP